ncbi:DNA repair protein XRCC3 isoform X2 [Anolis carolinensis]|uniref:DNA repair protein XRCC3 isoform X2 n=1 Tax=Anolis carolinensis TaxID=28377 RepID=UPI000462D8B2|nr:PREDICTED: DNA repair protein XRCC3 isoform X2 [Anolis carolinensis]|eukprot:XP_008104796.1 PREDICTED: DNA repair protein XRCC3 isoform X2 [Anolis carolinensis]
MICGKDAEAWDYIQIFFWLCTCQEMDLDQLDVNPRVIAAIKRALQLFKDKNQRRKLSLGCPVLDGFLQGGIPLTGITEIAGESSAGKTQIALQLALSIQYPYKYGGLESGAVYICTEDAFPNKRLQQLIQQQANLRDDVPPIVVQKIKFGNRIFVEHTADLDAFRNCITNRIGILLSRGMVRLIIVDSIAALFRCEFGAKDSVLKAKYLLMFGAKLHELSSQFQIPIVCINQVTDTMDTAGRAVHSPSCTAQRVAPALGITWSNQLLMRLMASRTVHFTQTANDAHQHNRGALRTLRVIFAPHLPQTSCQYTINLEGVRGIKEDILAGL